MDAWGITDGYWDVAGDWHPMEDDLRDALLAAVEADGDAPPWTPYWSVTQGEAHPLDSLCEIHLEDGTSLPAVAQLPPDLPVGYHQLRPVDEGPATRLVVAPSRCPEPPRTWGWATQLYALRSRWSWGVGDLGDLRDLIRWTAGLGGGAVLVNPLHASTPVLPQQPSPYYPSSRRFRNVLYLRVADVPGAARLGAELRPLDEEGRSLVSAAQLERDRALALKLDALQRIFALEPEPGDEHFQRWRDEQGSPLEQWATYCTIAEIHGPGWATWPEELRHPGAARALQDAAPPERVRFHAWCQWLLDEQLRAASTSSPAALLQDLAVGFAPDGFDAWCDQDLLAFSCRLGAPPDELGPEGQDWGLPPYVPWKLRAANLEPFIAAIRAALRHAQGLRIDHVMGLFRQYWIPEGAGPDGGGYVRFPAEELLDVVAVEASRQGAFVIGEDLGTVEPEVSWALRRRGMLGTTLGWFEDDPPTEYEPSTVTALTTHDLPTAAGVVTGADAAAIHRLGRQFDDTKIRRRLEALAPDTITVPDTILTAYRSLATAPTRLVLAQIDDAVCAIARPNLPGTVDEWPNWCLPLPVGLEQLITHPTGLALAQVLRERPPPPDHDGQWSRRSPRPSSPARSSARGSSSSR